MLCMKGLFILKHVYIIPFFPSQNLQSLKRPQKLFIWCKSLRRNVYVTISWGESDNTKITSIHTSAGSATGSLNINWSWKDVLVFLVWSLLFSYGTKTRPYIFFLYFWWKILFILSTFLSISIYNIYEPFQLFLLKTCGGIPFCCLASSF